MLFSILNVNASIKTGVVDSLKISSEIFKNKTFLKSKLKITVDFRQHNKGRLYAIDSLK